MKQKPIITKPDSSRSKRVEPNHSTLRPTPPSNPKHKSINPRFNPKIIPEKYLLNPDDFEPLNIESIIGFFSTINFVRNKSTGQRYAAKTSNRQTNLQTQKFLLRELNILMKIEHPTIIHFEGFSMKDFKGYNNITIFIDYKEEGSLFNILEKERRSLLPKDFDNTKRQKILIGICRGMKFLHKNNIIHRDLKPENILVDKDYKPYITDFGLSKIFTTQNSQSQSMSTCGTYAYMAPEVIESNHFGIKADVYAFGILMYEVVTGMSAIKNMCKNKPFNARKFMNSVVDGTRPTFGEEKIKPGLKKMIEQCWSNDPNDRPTFSELYSKLSLNDENYYIDSNNNICESLIKCNECDNNINNTSSSKEEEETLISTKYCFDYVDFDELFEYIDEIDDEIKISNEYEELQNVKEEIKEIKTFTEKFEKIEKENIELKKTISKIQNENTELKKDISKIQKENIELKKNISKVQNENTEFDKNISRIQKENTELKSAISELKQIIFKKKNEQQTIIQKNIFDPTKKPTDNELYKQCNELSQKVKTEKLTSIELPQYLQKVPDSIFKECNELKAVTIPSSVTSIGKESFYECSSLTQITFSIPSSVTSIGSSAFYGCSSLTQITIPSSVTSIGDHAFFYCKSLTQITNPSSVTSIGSSAFCGCSSLTQITIPSSVTSIGDYAFDRCSSLTQITIPSSVTNIGDSIFSICPKLENISIIPCEKKKIEYIDNKFLVFNTTSTSNIFDTLVFAKRTINTAIIPSFIKTIKSGAFYGCSSLTQITIPSSVTSIGSSAFYGCSSLTQITFSIPSSVTSIGFSAFSDCKSLTQITIPSSVTSIGEMAFNSCSSLTQISIPSSVTSIGYSTFGMCSSLTQITIPSSVTSIGSRAFSFCSSLTQIKIPFSVTEICYMAFTSCSSLTQITFSIPSSVTSIGSSAFSFCSSLTQITIPSSVTSIGNEAFYYCSSLTQISIPSSVTSIGDSAFKGCSSLTQITIPSSLTSICNLPSKAKIIKT